jgi:hypothetical protein
VKQQVVDKLPDDKEVIALARLELLTAHLEDSTGTVVPASILDDFTATKNTLGYAMALERLARHNAKLGGQSEVLALAEGLDEPQKALVQIGVGLGLHDAQK